MNNENNIEVGDVVKLKSDTYPMTVQRILDWQTDINVDGETGIECIWRNSDGTMSEQRFDIRQLIKFDPTMK